MNENNFVIKKQQPNKQRKKRLTFHSPKFSFDSQNDRKSLHISKEEICWERFEFCLNGPEM